MKTLLKVLAWLIGAAVILVVVAVVVVPMVVDPNDFRDDIAREVKENTGRDLRIIGDMEISVFPWLGIDIGEVELGNAPGFDDPVFAKVRRAEVRVKLVPLLRREVEMDTIVLHGLAVNLARNAKGNANWEDLVASGKQDAERATPTADTGSGQMPVAAVFVGGVDLRDASLAWRDETSGQRLQVANLSLRTGALAAGEPVDLEFSLDVEVGDPALSGHLAGGADVALDAASGDVRVAGLNLNGDFEGGQLPGGKASLRVSAGQLDVTDDARSVAVNDLLVEGLGVKLEGDVNAAGPWGKPTLTGAIETNEFSPRRLLEALALPEPETADPKALSKASMRATLGGAAGRVEVEPLVVTLDDSTLQGKVAVHDLSRPAVRFTLALDAIDADRYLAPPPTEGAPGTGGDSAPTPGSAAAGAGGLPVDTLRGLDLAGTLDVGRLKISGLKITDIVATLEASDGLIRLHPIGGALYQGRYDGNIVLDARRDQVEVRVDEKLSGVQVGPLLQDLAGEDRLSGTADVHAEVRALGTAPEAIKRTMKGQVRFAFTDGAYRGINVARKIREALALVKGERLEPAREELKTDFSQLTGTVRVADGVATNEDLVAKSPLLRIEGKGRADLMKETLDYRLTTTLVGTIEGQGGKGLEELKGVPIPIRVRGPVRAPEYALDQEALVKALAESKAKDLVEKHLGAEKAKTIKKKDLEKEAEKLLKGVLGR